MVCKKFIKLRTFNLNFGHQLSLETHGENFSTLSSKNPHECQGNLEYSADIARKIARQEKCLGELTRKINRQLKYSAAAEIASHIARQKKFLDELTRKKDRQLEYSAAAAEIASHIARQLEYSDELARHIARDQIIIKTLLQKGKWDLTDASKETAEAIARYLARNKW
jgi:superfamily I DNA and RNA helicase